ncbi:hypothetical protein NQ318_015008 [Aromia moschata]|uniref:Uncharacterized protein n=1 Tax=Aromia moschata TaxID=1265417 RepID=A0AAV8YXH3_9CUCU|nr:hypothetical protein NQ318_015008 [Aromia moschata]
MEKSYGAVQRSPRGIQNEQCLLPTLELSTVLLNNIETIDSCTDSIETIDTRDIESFHPQLRTWQRGRRPRCTALELLCPNGGPYVDCFYPTFQYSDNPMLSADSNGEISLKACTALELLCPNGGPYVDCFYPTFQYSDNPMLSADSNGEASLKAKLRRIQGAAYTETPKLKLANSPEISQPTTLASRQAFTSHLSIRKQRFLND